MKKILFLLQTVLITFSSFAQQSDDKTTFLFPITNYIVPSGDSIVIVQVALSGTVKIDAKQFGLIKKNFANDDNDTSIIGTGKCQLIKGEFYYFGIRLYDVKKKPVVKDLLYTRIHYPTAYKGLIFGLTKNAIYLKKITDSAFYNFETALNLTERGEDVMIRELMTDINNTGLYMQQQNNSQEQLIKGGLFDGKQLFQAMRSVGREEVIKFLKYVNARPKKYAGNSWKVSEIFATWMVNETPTVIE